MFTSTFLEVGKVRLPEFSGVRVMMMPVVIGDMDRIPDRLSDWREALGDMFSMSQHHGETGYLTIDEKLVAEGLTHRRAGLHVDGIFEGHCGSWGGGGWGSVGNGMITVSSHAGCRAWNQEFDGHPGYDGECEHLKHQCGTGTLFEAGVAYWVDGLCVHESVPMGAPVERQFVRLSMPSSGPWFDGYTPNDKGVMPTGRILPRRKFMDT